jgi:hypothetical protein
VIGYCKSDYISSRNARTVLAGGIKPGGHSRQVLIFQSETNKKEEVVEEGGKEVAEAESEVCKVGERVDCRHLDRKFLATFSLLQRNSQSQLQNTGEAWFLSDYLLFIHVSSFRVWKLVSFPLE